MLASEYVWMICTEHLGQYRSYVQYAKIACTTQYTLYSMCTDLMYRTVYTVQLYRSHECCLKWNYWGTHLQKPSFVQSNEHQRRHTSLYSVCVHAWSKAYRNGKFH